MSWEEIECPKCGLRFDVANVKEEGKSCVPSTNEVGNGSLSLPSVRIANYPTNSGGRINTVKLTDGNGPTKVARQKKAVPFLPNLKGNGLLESLKLCVR